MGEANITQCLLYPELFDKPVHVKFDEPHSSSDGGALLLRAADQKFDLVSRLAKCLPDERQSGKVKHPIDEMIRQRAYGLAAGYADANDSARLAGDPVMKMLLGRSIVDREAVSSQPTISRFENSVGRRELYRFGQTLAVGVIDRHHRRLKGRVKRVTIDLDPTDDLVHGAQQLSFFNAYYGGYCYLPVVGFVSFDNEPEQYLVTAVLRPGDATAKDGAVAILGRMVGLIRAAFPHAVIEVRLDGGFACPEVFEYLGGERRLEYVCGVAKNAVLLRHAEELMTQARARSEKSGETEHVYGDCLYQAGTWAAPRRVVIKAEVVRNSQGESRDNPRFVVTNKKLKPKKVYRQCYCARGDIENRIKELKDGMQIDRTSCETFEANQFRVLLTAAAYVLMQEIRLQAKRTSLGRAQVSTLREKLLKLSARVEESVRRIVVHLPESFAYLKEFTTIAKRLGAESG